VHVDDRRLLALVFWDVTMPGVSNAGRRRSHARYGALGVLGSDGGLEDFITHGVTDEQRAAIGALPVGRGLLGALINDA